MIFEGLNIIIISPDSWDGLPVSKHQYAIELAKRNNKVFFINPHEIEIKEEDGVKIISAYKKIRGLGRMPKALAKKLMNKEVKSILKQTGVSKVDLVWSFDTSRLYYLDLFGATIKIAHVVDYSEHFHFQELVSSADYSFATSDSITDKMKQYDHQVFKINHGFVVSNNMAVPTNFAKSNCIYIGNLTIPYLDWETVFSIVEENDEVKFEFIGSRSGNLSEDQLSFMRQVEAQPNACFFDKVSPDKVSERIRKADFCLMVYDFAKYPEQLQNPHKLMQYLGSGKPVFSSFTHEFQNTDVLYMFTDKTTASSEFKKFIADEKGLFTEAEAVKRINFAMDNTYAKQIERIEQIINE